VRFQPTRAPGWDPPKDIARTRFTARCAGCVVVRRDCLFTDEIAAPWNSAIPCHTRPSSSRTWRRPIVPNEQSWPPRARH
jgi:hypothetical protein